MQFLDLDSVAFSKYSGQIFLGSHALAQAAFCTSCIVKGGLDSVRFNEFSKTVLDNAHKLGAMVHASHLSKLPEGVVQQNYATAFQQQDKTFRPYLHKVIFDALGMNTYFGVAFFDGRFLVFSIDPIQVVKALYEKKIGAEVTVNQMLNDFYKHRIITNRETCSLLNSGSVLYWNSGFVTRLSEFLGVSMHLFARVISEKEDEAFVSKHPKAAKTAFPMDCHSSLLVRLSILEKEAKSANVFTTRALISRLSKSKAKYTPFPKSFEPYAVTVHDSSVVADAESVLDAHPECICIKLDPSRVLEPQLRFGQAVIKKHRKQSILDGYKMPSELFGVSMIAEEDSKKASLEELKEVAPDTDKDKRKQLLERAKEAVMRAHEKATKKVIANTIINDPRLNPLFVPAEPSKETVGYHMTSGDAPVIVEAPTAFDDFYAVYAKLSKDYRGQLYASLKKLAFTSFEDRLRIIFNSLNSADRKRLVSLAQAALTVQKEFGVSGEKDADE